MAQIYSAYEAKAKFSEVIRRVRAGQRIIVTYRDKEVAEIRPVESKGGSLQRNIERLEDEGVLSPHGKPVGRLQPLAHKPGALARFLESRE
jgi:prevent-host-death family protein